MRIRSASKFIEAARPSALSRPTTPLESPGQALVVLARRVDVVIPPMPVSRGPRRCNAPPPRSRQWRNIGRLLPEDSLGKVRATRSTGGGMVGGMSGADRPHRTCKPGEGELVPLNPLGESGGERRAGPPRAPLENQTTHDNKTWPAGVSLSSHCPR